MTNEQINELIAEKIMGLPIYWHEYYLGDKGLTKCGPFLNSQSSCESVNRKIPSYSTDIAAAWEVMEKMQDYRKPPQEGHPLRLEYHWWINKWWACIGSSEADADIAPRAIILAALKAKGVEIDD